MNVLSLFDGMSCGQQALARAGIKVNKYYASEIDKHAIRVTQHNYPNTIQLGSVTEVNVADLEPIDLLIGGSPCQSFSFAGKRNGMTTSCNEEIYTLERYLELKADGFEFEGESYLFWEYMRILTDIRKYNPGVLFLLENVEMGAKWERVLSEAIGIYGVHINSALVSAQNRKRIYWTNIRVKEVGLFGELHSDIPQPEDRGILLKDILEDEVDDKYYLSDKMLIWLDKRSEKRGVEVKKLDGEQKTGCLTATAQVKQNLTTDYICISSTQKNATVTTNKSSPMTAAMGMGGGHVPMIAINSASKDLICVAMRGRGENNEQTLEPQLSGKTNTLTSVQKDNLIVHGVDYRTDEGFRFRNNGKSGTLQARARNDESCGQLASIGTRIRRLTPLECERLQTVEDNYTSCVSDTQRYKMLGNGWTVEVIAHIFRHIIH
jgi:DNA-cytosine methyltransferase